MTTVTLDEARALKAETENQIAALLLRLTEETGMEIDDVDIDTVKNLEGVRGYIVEIKMTL